MGASTEIVVNGTGGVQGVSKLFSQIARARRVISAIEGTTKCFGEAVGPKNGVDHVAAIAACAGEDETNADGIDGEFISEVARVEGTGAGVGEFDAGAEVGGDAMGQPPR